MGAVHDSGSVGFASVNDGASALSPYFEASWVSEIVSWNWCSEDAAICG